VLRLLPEPATESTQLGGAGRPWSLTYGTTRAILRWNDAARWRAFGYADDVAVASIEWLHALLRDLASVGFVAPRPLDDLAGQSIAVMTDGIWELLTRVPGRAMGWTDDEMVEAGRLLARFHGAALRLPQRPQRPGAQPFAACDPAHPEARSVRAEFEREMGALNGAATLRGVIHGDATQANVVIADDGTFQLVDFALAYVEHVLADIGSGLWRNGRASADSITYDPGRAARFVRGYNSVRPLGPEAPRAIVTLMKGRGLQLQHRLELRHGRDESVMQRLRAIVSLDAELVAALEGALN